MALTDLTETFCSEMADVRRVLDRIRTEIDTTPEFAPLGDTAQIILGEVLNNVVEHAYQFDGGHPIQLRLSFDEGALGIHVIDEGIAMPDGKPPNGGMPELDPANPESLPEGGFGWAMIHAMTEGLAYSRKDGKNHLVFSIPKSAA